MIGFRPPNAGPVVPADPHVYVAARRSRFVQLAITSDDWVLVTFIAFFFLGIIVGIMVPR